MARSSGGGSRSGGSHSGGSRSSGGSRGGSGGGSSRSYHTSSTPKAGCSKYIYYDKHRKAHFVYCDYDPSEPRSPLRYALLLFYLPFFGALLTMLSGLFTIWAPENKDYIDAGRVIIEDNINVIQDKNALETDLKAFYDKTGVTPAVITVDDKDWWSDYASLEIYATELYYTHFDDEKHWLIVYSEPVGASFNDWKFEGILGEHTTNAIPDSTMNYLTNQIQSNLYKYTNAPDKAIGTAFNKTLTDGITYFRFNYEMLFMVLLFGGFIFLHCYMMIFNNNGRKYYKDAKKVEEQVTIITCAYCGGTYGSDVTLACPHCNAPVTVLNNNNTGIYVKESNKDMV